MSIEKLLLSKYFKEYFKKVHFKAKTTKTKGSRSSSTLEVASSLKRMIFLLFDVVDDYTHLLAMAIFLIFDKHFLCLTSTSFGEHPNNCQNLFSVERLIAAFRILIFERNRNFKISKYCSEVAQIFYEDRQSFKGARFLLIQLLSGFDHVCGSFIFCFTSFL